MTVVALADIVNFSLALLGEGVEQLISNYGVAVSHPFAHYKCDKWSQNPVAYATRKYAYHIA
jgi:hypothetical protein